MYIYHQLNTLIYTKYWVTFEYEYLVLKGEDVTNASVDGIAKPSQCLVSKSDDSIESLARRNHHEEFGGVARPEDLVHRREVRRPFLRVKVGSEDAFRHAFPPEKLACTARTSTAGGASAHLFCQDVTFCFGEAVSSSTSYIYISNPKRSVERDR